MLSARACTVSARARARDEELAQSCRDGDGRGRRSEVYIPALTKRSMAEALLLQGQRDMGAVRPATVCKLSS